MVFAPATDENLRLHFVRFMVFAGPASDRIFVRQTARFEVLTGPATDEILGYISKAHGLCWACRRQNFRAPDCHVCGFDWACRR